MIAFGDYLAPLVPLFETSQEVKYKTSMQISVNVYVIKLERTYHQKKGKKIYLCACESHSAGTMYMLEMFAPQRNNFRNISKKKKCHWRISNVTLFLFQSYYISHIFSSFTHKEDKEKSCNIHSKRLPAGFDL